MGPADGGYFVYFGFVIGYYVASNDGGITWAVGSLGDNDNLTSVDWLPGQQMYLASSSNGNLFVSKQLISADWQPFLNPLPVAEFGGMGVNHVYGTTDGQLYVAVQTEGNLIFTGQPTGTVRM